VSKADQLIQADVVARASRLELVARETVEGFISGLHKSPFHGLSVEFRQHRNYSYGDDLRHLDWKVYGKTDRYYIKEYEKETNVRVYIAVDASRSMAYGPEGNTKYDYASRLAACMAYLMHRQQDAPALFLFTGDDMQFLPARTSTIQMTNITHSLATTQPEGQSDLPAVLGRIASEAHPNSVVVVVSDLLADLDGLLHGLREIRQRKHDTIVFQIVDEDELGFPFHRMTRFKDLESPRSVIVEAHFLQKAFVREFSAFIEAISTECQNTRIDHTLMPTSEPLAVALTAYLASRNAGRRHRL